MIKKFYYLDNGSIKATDDPKEWTAIRKRCFDEWTVFAEQVRNFKIVTRFLGLDARDTHPESFGKCKSPVLWTSNILVQDQPVRTTYVGGSLEHAEAMHKHMIQMFHVNNSP